MKIPLVKRLLSFLLAVVMFIGLLPQIAIPKAQAAELYQDLYNAVAGLGYPVATRVWTLPNNMSGLWIITNYKTRADDPNGTRKYVMNPDSQGTWGPPDFPNTHTGYNVAPLTILPDNKLDIPHSKYYTRITGNINSMQLRDYRGLYWDHVYGNSGNTYGNFQLTTWSSVYYTATAAGNSTYRVSRNGASDIVVYVNGYTFRVAMTGKMALDKYTQYQLEFYKVSEEVLALRDLIQQTLKYVVSNANGRFDQATYDAYLNFVYGAAVAYNNQFRTVAYDAVNTTALNDLKTQIWDWMGKMRLADRDEQYMDIPVEILDFRGDGFLFESSDAWTVPYSFSKKSPGQDLPAGSLGKFPGNYDMNNSDESSDNYQITGLVEDTLVDGKVVYTPESVDYIAYHLSAKTSIKGKQDKMNGAFIDKINSNTLKSGTYEQTIAKCDPSKPGGELHWGQVETFHDMAYYLLSHMWSQTDDVLGTDTYANGTSVNYSYNTEVTELTKLRLFKNGQTYSYSADQSSIFDSGYILNDSTTRPYISGPIFRPLDGKGFESADRYGVYTEGDANRYMPEVNYGFTIHAYGAFIYNEDRDLYFTFGGDDDVYFFINGQLICDIGGIHGNVTKTEYLNNWAATLGLEEGQVCRFDMFHAERHTSGINFSLSTNIQIMDETAVTDITLHDPESDQSLLSGVALNTGEEIAYAFSVQNFGVIPVNELKFVDTAIGVTLDSTRDTITLNSRTSVQDLTLIYQGYDPYANDLYDGSPETISDYNTMYNLILAAMQNPEESEMPLCGAYRYVPKSQSELISLLKLGIPVACKLTLKGFRYAVPKGEFINSLSTFCTPVRYTASTFVPEADPVTGVASVTVNGMDLSSITLQKPYSVVLDYGKPVEMNPNATGTFIKLGNGMHMEYVGSTFNGEHGQIRGKQPINLTFTAAGQSYESDYGIFEMVDGDTLRYTPKGFIEAVDTFYAVYKITLDGQADFKAFLLTAVEFLPAHMVYYEAENFTNEISITKKATVSDAVSIQNEWNSENYSTEGTVGDVLQDHSVNGQEMIIPDYSNNPDVLFFSFDNTANDRTRYNLLQYGGVGNYDDPANQNKLWYAYQERAGRVTKYEIKNGAMVITAQPQAGAANATSGDVYPDLFIDTIYGGNLVGNTFNGWDNCPLKYDPSRAEVVQIRFKLKNFKIGTEGNVANSKQIFPFLKVQSIKTAQTGIDYSKGADTGFLYLHPDMLNSDEYVTITAPCYSGFYTAGTLKRLRFYWGGLESISSSQLGELTIDYLYVGPYDCAPTEVGYGFDRSYIWNDKLSDGESLYVEGNGVRLATNPDPDKYTEINFDFTGTGFDLITCTGADQGTLRVEVYKDEGKTQLVKAMSVQTKGELELFQIPTVSVQDLPHGKYYVSLMVNDAVTGSPFAVLNRGNQLYLDAIRIYDPIDTSKGTASTEPDSISAYTAYCGDSEAHAEIQEVRELLLTANQFNALQSATTGAVYVDSGKTTTSSIATYQKVGPKNEVYLSQNQKIVFRLDIKSKELPNRLDIGCKTVSGTNVYLKVAQITADVNAPSNERFVTYERRMRTATAMYYPIHIWKQGFRTDASGSYIYIILENTGVDILSITDIKVAYDHTPTALAVADASLASLDTTGAKKNSSSTELPMDSFVKFTVDEKVSEILDAWIDFSEKGIHDHILGQWIPNGEVEERFCEACGLLMDSRQPITRTDLAFIGASISLQSNLGINYKVNGAYFTETGYYDPYVVVTDNGTEAVLRDYEIVDGIYSFTYRNIAPHRMGDAVSATLYASYNGELYCSESKEYSVAEYCYNQLHNSEGLEAYAPLRTLLVNILHYGAETQKYMSYRLDSLCNAKLTEAELAYGTSLTRELVGCRNAAYETVDAPTVKWSGAGLNLRESVAIRIKFSTESYEGLEIRVTLAGETYVIGETDFDYRTDGTYVHFQNLTAAQMSEPIYVRAYRDGVQVSNTMSYSIESYAYAKQNDTSIPYLADLVKAMMAYGDACRSYTNNKA